MDELEAVHAHRRDYWLWVDEHADPRMRDTLLRLRAHWHHVNDTYFGGAMVEPYITLTEPSMPRILGQCCPVSSWGSRLEIRVRPSLVDGTHPHVRGGDGFAEGRMLFVLDVLLHEAIHQYDREVENKPEESYHGHGPVFAGHANSIGAILGLPEVVARNRGGSKLPRAANWPHVVRDPDFYLGAYVPSTGDTETKTVKCPCCEGTGRIRRDDAVAWFRMAAFTGDPGYARVGEWAVDLLEKGADR